MSATDKPKVGVRERLRAKRQERKQKEAERIDRARREGARRPEDIRRDTGTANADFGGT